MSWGTFAIVGFGIFAVALLLVGLGFFVTDEILDSEDPEDRWANR